MDNARYQRCYFIMDLSTALGIELLFLPLYSPNLNLVDELAAQMAADPAPMGGEIVEAQPGDSGSEGDDESDEII